jgi:hypothetical protein
MYTLIRSRRLTELAVEQAPSLAASLLIAEAFYKFGSFALECLAFLATWYALDVVVQTAKQLVTRTR